jgi:polyhydroxyalkanoate synthesis regulator phasin
LVSLLASPTRALAYPPRVDNALQRVAQVTQRSAGAVVRTIVRQGEAAADRAEQVVNEVLGRAEADREALVTLVRGETERTVARLGLAHQSDVDELHKRISELEARLEAATRRQRGR